MSLLCSWLKYLRVRAGRSHLCIPRLDLLGRRGGPLFRPALESLEDRIVPDAVTWNVATSGNWNVAANWLDTTNGQNQVPTAIDDVTINQAGVTITVSDAESAHTLSTASGATLALTAGSLAVGSTATLNGNLTLSGGTLSLGGAATLAGTSTWSGGTIAGSGALTNSGTLDVAAGSSTFSLANALNNTGTIDVQSGTLKITGAISQVSGTTLTGGSWDVANNATLNLASAPSLMTSQATIALAGPAAGFPQIDSVTTIDGSLSLTNGAGFSAGGALTIGGNVSLDTGTLQLNNHSLTIQSAGALSLGSVTGLSGETQVTNAGTFTLGGSGTLKFSVPFNNQGGTIDLQAGNLTFGGGGTSTGGTFVVAGGSALDLTGSSTANYTGTYTGSGAGQVQLAGGGAIVLGAAGATFNFPAGLFQWTHGDIDGGGGDLTNTGFLSIVPTSNAAVRIGVGLSSVVILDNQGTINQFGAGSFELIAGELHNDASAVYDFQSDGTPFVAGVGTFVNAGTITKSQGSGTTTLSVFALNNSGTLDAQSGTLDIASISTSSNGGTFDAAPTAMVQLAPGSDGNTVWNGSFTGSGGGLVQFTGGDIRVGSGGMTFNFPAGMFQWTGGAIDRFGGGDLTNTGFLSIVSTSNAAVSIAGLILDNQGTINQSGAGSFELNNGGEVENEAGGVYDFQSDGTPFVASIGTFINAGTITKSQGTGTTTLSVGALNNSGTLDAESGTLAITSDSTSSNGGTFDAAPAAVLQLVPGSDSNTVWTGRFTGSGGGLVQFTGGEIVAATAGMTFDFPAGLFQWTGGTIACDSGGLVTNTGFLTIAPASSAAVKIANLFSSIGTLANQGTINQTGTGSIGLSGGELENEAGGVYDFQSDGTPFVTSVGSFINAGTITKSQGTGTTTLSVGTLNNSGTLNVVSGTLAITSDSTSSTGGTFDAAPAAVLQLVPGSDSNTVWNGSFTGSGGGLVQFTGGDIVAGSAGMTFAFPAGMFQWTGGNIDREGGGTFTNAGFMTITGTTNLGGAMINSGTLTVTNSSLGLQLEPIGATLTNTGTLIVTSTGEVQPEQPASGGGSSVTNAVGGTLQLQLGGQIGFGNTGGLLANQGLVQVNGGSGTATIDTNPFNNTGTVEVDSGTLVLTNVTQVSGSTLTAGTWEALNGGTIQFPAGTNITTNDGNLTLSGAGSTISGIANLATNAGNLTLANASAFSTVGGFSNTGTLTLGPAVTLAVKGAYTQGANATLQEQLGGAPASGNFGRITATAASALNGTFQIQLVNGYGPNAGDSFQALTFPSETGAFATIEGPFSHADNLFQVTTGASAVTVAATVTAADLAVSSVTATPANVQAGQSLTVNYSVHNQGNATPVNSWVDSVFLSTSGVVNASAILLDRVTHTGAVAADGGYSESLTVPVPPALPGSYQVVVDVDSQGLVPDANRANNVLASSPIEVSVPTLTLTTGGSPSPATGSVAAGQGQLYELNIPAGQTVHLSATFGTAGAGAVLIGYHAIPTDAANLQEASIAGQAEQQLTLKNTQQGTYFVVVEGQAAAGAGTSFNISAQEEPFGISGFIPNSGSTAGSATLTINGTFFTPATTVSLVGADSKASPASTVTFRDATTLFATFDLTALAPGTYQVEVQDGTQVATAAQSFSVTAGNLGRLSLQLNAPAAVRLGRQVTVTVDYANVGGADLPAPLLELSADSGELKLDGQASFTSSGSDDGGPNVQFLATNPDGLASVLGPGASGKATFTFIATTGGTAHFQLEQMIPGGILAWSSMETQLQPAGIDSTTWNTIFNNFLGQVGASTDQYQFVLEQDADYFQSIGEPTQDVSRLLNFELERAGDFGAIALRNRPGAFGLGVPDTVTNFAATDPTTGDVTIQIGGDIRHFTLQPGGTYQAQPGDTSTLTLTNGIYQLRELDGTLTQFRADGKLDFIEDTNGNKLTAGYDSQGRMISQTDSFGNVIAYAYNSQNLVSQITDAVGRITSFVYDGSGRVTSITNPAGTVAFGYITDPGFADNNALQEITYVDGSHRFFVYDPLGRLLESFADNGANRVGYTYDLSPGEVDVNDALGDTVSYFLDDTEQTAKLIDPLGNVYATQFDANHNAIGLSLPQNLTVTLQRNGLGDPTQASNPLGENVSVTYGALNTPTSVTDPNGNTYTNTFNAAGDLTGTQFPDGTALSYTYYPNGQVETTTSRAGATITNTYNADGTLQKQVLSGGATFSYTYDAHKNLASITDPTGTTTFTYDNADRLLTVTYPSGQELTYSYDPVSGRRTSMTDVKSGFTVNYSYTALGQLAELTDKNGNLIAKYTYDDAGRMIRSDLGNGAFSTYVYDADGRLLQLTNFAPGGSTVLSSYAYTYDSLGDPISETTLAGTTSFGYDATGQLISVALPGGRTITYAYDANGNRSTVSDSAAGATPYSSNNLNEYTQVGGSKLTYDANGDLISDGTNTYTYNALGQLTGVQTPGGAFSYSYNALGQRVSMTANGVTTNFTIDPVSGLDVSEANASGSVIADNVFGAGLVSRVAAGAASYYTFDATGNTSEMTNSAGSVLDSYSYLPFGEQLSATGSTPNPFTYNGALGVSSRGDGLDFMTNRSYDPALGRFTTPDPLGFNGGDANIYRYVVNSPVLATDPTGLYDLDVNTMMKGGNRLGGNPATIGGVVAQSGAIATGGAVLSGNPGNVFGITGIAAGNGVGADSGAGQATLDGGNPFGTPSAPGAPDLGTPSAPGAPDLGTPAALGAPDFGTPRAPGAPDLGTPAALGAPDFGTPSAPGAPDLGTPAALGAPDPGSLSPDGSNDGYNSDTPNNDPQSTTPPEQFDVCTLAQSGSLAGGGAAFVLDMGSPPADPPPLPNNEKLLPNGVIQITNADGTTTELFPEGDVLILNTAGGIAQVQTTDGATFGFSSDYGTVTVTEGVVVLGASVDGSFSDAGGVHPGVIASTQSNVDGTKTITYTNGTTETVITATGEATFRYPSGITATAEPSTLGGIDLHIRVVTTRDLLTVTLSGPIFEPNQATVTGPLLPVGGSNGGSAPNQPHSSDSGNGPFTQFPRSPDGGATPPSDVGDAVTHNADGSVQDSTQGGPDAPGATSNAEVTKTTSPDGSGGTTATDPNGNGVVTSNTVVKNPKTGNSLNTTVTFQPQGEQANVNLGSITFPTPPPPAPVSTNSCGGTALGGSGTIHNIVGIITEIINFFTLSSIDPNALTGPAGFGSQEFVAATDTLPYRIDFTNEATATAPAQTVAVTQQLDPHLDLNTFQLGDIGFGGTTISVPAGLTSFNTTVTLPSTAPGAGPNGLEVQISASLSLQSRTVTWTFTSIDPSTQDIPINPLEGFLPPDVTAPAGEGFVTYTIQPLSALKSEAAITAQAAVTFDVNPPINTAKISNTIDPIPPTSSVNPLPAYSRPSFTVSWAGQDDPGGSGVATFDVYVSDNGGAPTPFVLNTTAISGVFSGGQDGHTYTFFSVATDNVGNVQPTPTSAQASTTVEIPSAIVFASPAQTVTAGKPSQLITVELMSVRNVEALAGGDGVTINLSSSSAAGIFLDSSGHPLSGNSVTIPAGGSTATFEYQDGKQGTPTLTAAATGLTTATQQESVSPIALTLTSSANPAQVGKSVTLTASLRSVVKGVNIGSGTVTFRDGDAVLGTVAIKNAKTTTTATFKTSKLSLGSHAISVSYQNAGIVAPPPVGLSEVVQNTTTSLSLSPAAPVFGQKATFTATVKAVIAANGIPIGTVTFLDGTTVLGTGTLTIVGTGIARATFSTTSLPTGKNTITASYANNGVFTSSTSVAVNVTVKLAATTLKLKTSVNPVIHGLDLTLTAVIGVTAPGAGTPAGTVKFLDGVTVLGTATLQNVDGVIEAILTTMLATKGKHSLKAVFAATTDFAASTSAVVTETVK